MTTRRSSNFHQQMVTFDNILYTSLKLFAPLFQNHLLYEHGSAKIDPWTLLILCTNDLPNYHSDTFHVYFSPRKNVFKNYGTKL